MSGSIRVLWNEADSAVVTIYGPTGTAATGFKVNGNAVTFPYTLSASTTFTTNHIDRYSISVTYYGTEIAATPDGERVVDLGDSDELVFAPSPDAGKVMAPANDATLTAIFNDTSSDFRTAQAAAFAPLPGTIAALDALPYWIITHRGGGEYLMPEHTMDVYRAAVAQGSTCIECDVWLLADGSLAVMHDSTIDRTTSGTGNVQDQSAGSWLALTSDVSSYFGPPWKDTRPPLFSEVLDTFGGKVVINAEAKGAGTATALANMVKARKLQNSVILSTQDWASVAIMRAIDPTFTIAWTDQDNTTHTPAEVVAQGANNVELTKVGLNTSVPLDTATVTAYKNVGLRVGVAQINRHNERDTWLAAGVDYFYTQTGTYILQTTGPRTTDPFKSGSRYAGQEIGVTSDSPAGSSLSALPGWLTLVGPGSVWALQGWAVPYTANASYQIDLDAQFSVLGESSAFLSVMVGALTDYGWDDLANDPEQSAMEARIRQDGRMNFFKIASGVRSGGFDTATSALTAGQVFHLQINVTPTQVTVKRTDGTPVTLTAGSPYATGIRGRYLFIGKATTSTAQVAVSNVVITPQ